MGPVIFIGDELSAAGFRLTGIETIVAAPEDAATALSEARARAGLVLMTAALAGRLPSYELEAVQRASSPAFAVVPDILLRVPLPDLPARLRTALGIGT